MNNPQVKYPKYLKEVVVISKTIIDTNNDTSYKYSLENYDLEAKSSTPAVDPTATRSQESVQSYDSQPPIWMAYKYIVNHLSSSIAKSIIHPPQPHSHT